MPAHGTRELGCKRQMGDTVILCTTINEMDLGVTISVDMKVSFLV